MKHIAYTRHDGGLDICTPSAEIFAIMHDGGYWDGEPHWFPAWQVFLQIQDGIKPDAAVRFVDAIVNGGCDEAEVLDIIKDRDCAHRGTGHTILETEEIPVNRWLRDAWRLGHNSGQIFTDLETAREIHWNRLQAAVDEENKRRARAFRKEPPLVVDGDALREAIERADAESLLSVWPEGLPAQAVV